MKKEELKGLLFTGNDHPAHDWQATTPVIESILEEDPYIDVTVTENKADLASLTENGYDFLVLNYANYEDPEGLNEKSKAGFLEFLENRGGLIVLHFSNGAFHHSLKGAAEADWPEYRKIVRRIWDHDSTSAHDPYGEFEVRVSSYEHYLNESLNEFRIKDELYFNQIGDMSLKPLLIARSEKTGKDEPLAWAYTYGDARIFQSLLGHAPDSYEPEPYRKMLRRAVKWVCFRDEDKL